MIRKYELRKRYELDLSEAQMDKIASYSALYLLLEFHNFRGKNLPNLNPEWWQENYKWKSSRQIYDWQFLRLIKTGTTEWGFTTIRKTKGGYVLDLIKGFRFKNITTKKIECRKCKEVKPIDIFNICEPCGNYLKKRREYKKYVFGGHKQ